MHVKEVGHVAASGADTPRRTPSWRSYGPDLVVARDVSETNYFRERKMILFHDLFIADHVTQQDIVAEISFY